MLPEGMNNLLNLSFVKKFSPGIGRKVNKIIALL